jgi:hypothetical protein
MGVSFVELGWEHGEWRLQRTAYTRIFFLLVAVCLRWIGMKLELLVKPEHSMKKYGISSVYLYKLHVPIRIPYKSSA